MSAYLGREPLPPASLVAAATAERERRRAVTQAAVREGKVSAEKAQSDDVIWSNIVHFMRVLGGDRRDPRRWHPDDQALMARNVRATMDRMIIAHDAEKAGMTRDRIETMRHVWYALEFTLLYTKVHPVPLEQGRAAA